MRIYEVMWKDKKGINKRRYKEKERGMNLFNQLLEDNAFSICGIVAMDVARHHRLRVLEVEQEIEGL